MARIRAKDKVVVIAGKDKGKQGTVLKVLSDDRVVVEGVNIVKKHQKPNPQKGEVGGVVDKEKSIHISNIAIFNVEKNCADRIKYVTDDHGKKVRVFASTKELIDL